MATAVARAGGTRRIAYALEHAGLSDDAQAIFTAEMDRTDFLTALVGRELFVDAIRALAFCLAGPAAVRWACACVRQTLPAAPAPKAMAALVAAEQWGAQPTDELARRAQSAGEAAGTDTPAGCAALAAFFGGSNINPEPKPVIPPPPNVVNNLAAGAILLAGVAGEPEQTLPRYQDFVTRGLELAKKEG